MLTGVTLRGPQLDGVNIDAQLEGASLRHTYVWRTDPPSSATGAFVATPEPGPKYIGLNCSSECDWSAASYAALKSLIENSIPNTGGRHKTLEAAIKVLEKPPYVTDEGSAAAWTNLANESARSAGTYFNTLAKMFEEIGCAPEGAPHVISGLIRPISSGVLLDHRFEGSPSQEAEVAATFLDEAKCPGARGLSEENKAKLQEIRDRVPAPLGPGATAR